MTDSNDPKQYIKKMRARDKELDSKWGTICTPLQMLAPDGKMRKTQTANIEGILRIIQSIKSPKAEPFKVWLGPGHVQEFYRGVPNCMIIDSNKELVKDMLIRDLGKAYGVELPICEAVYQILYEDANPQKILEKLFSRSLRNEFV